MARTARWLVANPPAVDSQADKVLQDPFDYEWEDRLIDAWRGALDQVRLLAEQFARPYRDRYADGRRHELNNRR